MCASYSTRWSARGDHSPRATPRQPLRSPFERASSIWLSLLVVLSLVFFPLSRPAQLSLSAGASFLRVSLPALFILSSMLVLCSRLCRHSVSSLPLLWSSLVSPLCLGCASRSSRATTTLINSSKTPQTLKKSKLSKPSKTSKNC